MAAFAEGIERVGKVKGPDGKIQTKELLDVCREVVLIVGELACAAAGRGKWCDQVEGSH